ncbi:amidohydrolase family protein [Aspergillus tanneri]|uniref:Uncharacterized protein n=1 Tax=Aspergillus tanneri TaxID=1220188 RepID=A0A5M9MXM8_9EURO|nr:uncharacterized protein ATNIH1004_005300 [Aspergillus tanneri]KAA8649399.1 hypothetical protein ATNIH1004_005300 [Aspergillus tanneri]
MTIADLMVRFIFWLISGPDMLYTHATIVTVDPARRIIEDGAIYVQENIIADLDATSSLLRGTADKEALEPWLADVIRPLQRIMTTEEGSVAVQLSVAEMLKSGTTCFLESMFCSLEHHDCDQLCRVVQDSGIRGCLGQRALLLAPADNATDRSISNIV